jgi:hypothetical protein
VARLSQGQSRFIIAKVPRNSAISHVLDHVSNIPMECKSGQLCCIHFWFCGQVSYKGGFVLLFYDDDFWVLRDIKSYLRDYNFKFHSKFVVVNNMHRTNPEFPNKKVNLLSNSTNASSFHVSSILTSLLYYLSQTLMSMVLLLVHEKGSFHKKKSCPFQPKVCDCYVTTM